MFDFASSESSIILKIMLPSGDVLIFYLFEIHNHLLYNLLN